MGKQGYLIRYRCKNPDCDCDFFIGGADECCPLCGTNNVKIIARNVGE